MMRATLVLLTAAITLVPGLARAQTAAPSHKTATDVTKADIDAAVAKGIAALLPGVTVNDRLVNLSDMQKYNVGVAVVVRPAGKDARRRFGLPMKGRCSESQTSIRTGWKRPRNLSPPAYSARIE